MSYCDLSDRSYLGNIILKKEKSELLFLDKGVQKGGLVGGRYCFFF